jgi:hypothetical protein
VYVRWKASAPPRRSLRAVLVKSARVNGQPRQQIISYLGSIREADLKRTWPHIPFWEQATARLDALVGAGTITRADADTAENQLARRVPRLTAEERYLARRERLRQYASAYWRRAQLPAPEA